MASKVVLPRQQLKETSNGLKTIVSNGTRKGLVGGRAPLGYLSNSVKPSLNQASKKNNYPSIFSVTQNSVNATKKKSVQASGRKALSDISNSRLPKLNEGSKKNCTVKLSFVAEELIDSDAIAEEQFLHNHEECIKAQARAMDLEQVLQTLGLDNGRELQASPMAIKVESPPRYFELKEI